MDKGTILVYCCPSILYLLSDLLPPPPLPKPMYSILYTDSVLLWGGGVGVLKCTVDHILQEFYTLFLTRFRTYKIASPPPTKITSKDDIEGLGSLKFLRQWTLWYSRCTCTCTLWGGGKLKKLERNRDEVEEEEGEEWNTEEEGRRKLAFWITSADTQAESLSQSRKALLPIHNFSHP